MNAKLLIPVIAAAFLPLAAYAHDCSGGTDGGMDATGNQCNTETVATVASFDRAASSSTRLPKVEANKRASCTSCAAKASVAKRSASVRPQIKAALASAGTQ